MHIVIAAFVGEDEPTDSIFSRGNGYADRSYRIYFAGHTGIVDAASAGTSPDTLQTAKRVAKQHRPSSCQDRGRLGEIDTNMEGDGSQNELPRSRKGKTEHLISKHNVSRQFSCATGSAGSL